MRQEVIKSQVSTLTEWAEAWAREETAGYGEVAFLLRRVTKLMRKIAGDGDVETDHDDIERLPAAVEAEAVRAD